ncbi:MAG: VWA domain-containing protein [Pseudomonadota bacterium]
MNLKKLLGATTAAAGLALGASAVSAATIDLGFALDESGSVATSDFNLSKQGLANALNQIPTSGPNQYRISVIAFDSNARTIIAPTIVTAGNLAGLQAQINGIVNSQGGTDIAEAVDLLTANFVGVGLGAETYLNVATDGGSSANALALAAENSNNAGVDGLSFEAIGPANQSNLLRACYGGGANSYTDPGSGNTAAGCSLVNDPNNLPDATQEGFVLAVDNFMDFEGAIAAKVQSIVDDTGGGGPNVVPLPAGMPLLLVGIGAFAFARTRRKS